MSPRLPTGQGTRADIATHGGGTRLGTTLIIPGTTGTTILGTTTAGIGVDGTAGMALGILLGIAATIAITILGTIVEVE